MEPSVQYIPVQVPSSTANPIPQAGKGKTADDDDDEDNFNFTIVSWNTLAQSLVRRALYPFASKSTLKWKSRKKLFRDYLKKLDASIICMQEVDEITYWRPMLDQLGYGVAFTCCPGRTYGLCIAWKRDVFDPAINDQNVLHFNPVLLRNVEEGTLEHAELSLQHNIAQIMLLRHRSFPDFGLIILNTHLFWNPLYSYVRLKQIIYALEELNTVKCNAEFEKWPVLFCGDFNTNPDHIIYKICTNRNWDPDTLDIEEFLTPKEHFHKDSSKLLKSEDEGGDEDGSVGDDGRPNYREITCEENKERENIVRKLLHRLKRLPALHSANSIYGSCVRENVSASASANHEIDEGELEALGTFRPNKTLEAALSDRHLQPDWNGEPPYTNAWFKFCGTLDYICRVGEIWDDEDESGSKIDLKTRLRLRRKGLLSVPPFKDIVKQTALPNTVCPSDHVPIGVLIEAQAQKRPERTENY